MNARRTAAGILLALLSMSATTALAAHLGAAELEAEGAGESAPLRVYATGEAGLPSLTAGAAARWDARLDTLCATAVRDVPATLSGPGWSAAVTLRAVPEKKLSSMGLTLASGDWPDSAWETEMLLGAAAAEAVAEAAGRAGASFPSRVRLWIGGLAACGEAGVAAVEAAVAGAAAAVGDTTDPVVWVDEATLSAFIANNEAFCARSGLSADPVRIDVYLRGSADREAFAQYVTAQGYLVVDPRAEWTAAVAEARAMTVRWGVAAAVLALFCLPAAGWGFHSAGMPKTATAALAAWAAGVAAAVLIMQTAMLLGWDFFTAPEARYTLTPPRLLAAAGGCLALAFAGAAAGARWFRCSSGKSRCTQDSSR